MNQKNVLDLATSYVDENLMKLWCGLSPIKTDIGLKSCQTLSQLPMV